MIDASQSAEALPQPLPNAPPSSHGQGGAREPLAARLPDLRSIGRSLREAREARGISLDELADRLRLGSEQLRALEEGDREHLPEPVYVVAQLRRVAGSLDMDLGEQLDGLRRRTSTEHPPGLNDAAIQPNTPAAARSPRPSPEPIPPGRPAEGRQRRGLTLALPLAAGLAAMAGLGLWLAASRRPVPPPPAGASAGALAPALALGGQRGMNQAARPQPAPASLLLQASDTSWLEVRDGSGALLFRGDLRGSRRFSLAQGLRLLAGRPDLIQVSRAGEPPRPLGSVSRIVWVSFAADAEPPSQPVTGGASRTTVSGSAASPAQPSAGGNASEAANGAGPSG